MKLTDFTTPVGTKGNVLNPTDWIKLILGTVMFIVTFAMGQNFASRLGGKVPYIDAQIDKPYADPKPQQSKPNVRFL